MFFLWVTLQTLLVFQADADTKAVESCSQRDCEANNLGDQLGRLTVDEQIQSAPAPEVNSEHHEMALVICLFVKPGLAYIFNFLYLNSLVNGV